MLPIDHLKGNQAAVPAAGEWLPPLRDWLCLRLAQGHGYWLQGGTPCELGCHNVLLTHADNKGAFLASRLGEVTLQWFHVAPGLLHGLLTMDEQRALELAVNAGNLPRHFTAEHAVAQLGTALWDNPLDTPLRRRSHMLGLFAAALTTELAPPPNAAQATTDARIRLRQWLTQSPEAELLSRSVEDLARELSCSVRHFSRLFHEEVGVSFREKQTELRLLKAQQLLTRSDAKVIHVALESGYRHLGLFNALFKRRFGMTPTKWRRQSLTHERPRRRAAVVLRRLAIVAIVLAALPLPLWAQPATTNATNAATNAPAAKTNAPAGPVFSIQSYDVQGNTLLPTNVVTAAVSDFTGEKVGFDTIRQALSSLQLAYRGRGWATVSVGLPPQQITNGIVKVQVTEGRLAEINIVGNRWFSSNNVRSALPGLETNMFLNSKLFQAQLDVANGNRDRQIYPQIQPGPEPGTSALLLKVKDQFPLHGRFELNNVATPGTPELRGSASAQFNNLWQLEHSFGLAYGFALQDFKAGDVSFLDRPLIANYSAFYRLPLGKQESLPALAEANPQRFGYDEVTHKFNLPPSTGRSELNFYASRSTTDTGVKLTAEQQISPPPIALYSQDSGQDLSTTENIGFRWTKPLPQLKGVSSTLSLGADFKRFRSASFNTNNFLEDFTFTDPSSGQPVHRQIPFASPQPTRSAGVDYLPLAARWDGSRGDKTGTTSFGAGVNVNIAGGPFSDAKEFSKLTTGNGNYVTTQFSASREQRIYEDWSVLFKADGQWANQALISNEEFGLGGTAGVRGYQEGERYGSSGWRAAVEPRTPMLDIGLVDGTAPMRVRASAFMDYGQSYLYSGTPQTEQLWGTGLGFSGTIGTTFDFRLTIAWALHTGSLSKPGDMQVYFGIGAQF